MAMNPVQLTRLRRMRSASSRRPGVLPVPRLSPSDDADHYKTSGYITAGRGGGDHAVEDPLEHARLHPHLARRLLGATRGSDGHPDRGLLPHPTMGDRTAAITTGAAGTPSRWAPS